MTDFLPGQITLLAPHYLWAVLALPLLWWLLRLIPPEAIRRRFPSLRLLRNLPPLRAQTSYTPFWLLILRSVILLCLTAGFAEPVWRTGEIDAPPPDQPIIILIDNCWAAAPNFSAMRAKALGILDNLPPEQNIVVIAACPAGVNAVISQGVISTPAARAILRHLKLQDQAADWPRVLEAMRALDLAPIANVNVISSGLMNNADDLSRMLQELSAYDQVTVALPPENHLPVMLSAENQNGKIIARVKRFTVTGAADYKIITRNQTGGIVNLDALKIPDGGGQQTLPIPIPPEATDEVASLEIPDMGRLARAPWQAPVMPARIGLVMRVGDHSFIDPNRYVAAALTGQTQLVTDDWAALLGQNLPVIITADPELPPDQMNNIRQWLERGGKLIRFADKTPPAHGDEFMPARPAQILYHSSDNFLSNEAIGLTVFPADSPLHNLRPSAAPKFYQHWLIDTDDLDNAKVWASYDDQTPMILSRTAGQGESILITTPPTPAGGNWIFSGAFPDILHKIIERPRAAAPDAPAIQSDQLMVLNENNLPDSIEIADLNNFNAQTALAPYCFILAVLLWLADQALIVTRFAGLMRSER